MALSKINSEQNISDVLRVTVARYSRFILGINTVSPSLHEMELAADTPVCTL